MSNCKQCGKYIDTSDILCKECSVPSYHITYVPQPIGWRCPICGAGNSPYTDRCSCVPLPPPQITCW